MIELGQLERHHAAFATRGVRVAVASNDEQSLAQETQNDFKNLVVISDSKQDLAKAAGVIHSGAALDGKDTNAPMIFLIDGAGTVRWMYHSDRFVTRISPTELLKAVDSTMPKQ
jgi:alkyl hydroperoxide reductase subunit AhpC